MKSSAKPKATSQSAVTLETLAEVLEHVAHSLPAQAPIEDFVHHNTLHDVEHLPFHSALRQAAAQRQARVYLTEPEYRAEYAKGRISPSDLEDSLTRFLAARSLASDAMAHAILRAQLIHPIGKPNAAELRWHAAEEGALRKVQVGVSAEARAALLGLAPKPETEAEALSVLWAACEGEVARHALEEPKPPRVAKTHREVVRDLAHVDVARWVDDVIVPFCAAYLDEGMAPWHMPERSKGLFAAWRAHLSASAAPMLPWMDGVFARMASLPEDAAACALHELHVLDVRTNELETYLLRSLQELAGWAGMIHRLEHHPQHRSPDAGPVALMDFLAIRLLLTRLAIEFVAIHEKLGSLDTISRRRRAQQSAPSDLTASVWRVFTTMQHLGIGGPAFTGTPASVRGHWVDLALRFDRFDRSEVWQEAFERHYREQVLATLAANVRRPHPPAGPPALQVVFCIDDREESFRRHLEALSPQYETFGAAGFFGVAVAYKGIDDPEYTALCPVVVTPDHAIDEEPHPEDEAIAIARIRRRGLWAWLKHSFQRGSRSALTGAVLAPAVGLMTTFPMLSRLYFPRWTHKMSRRVQRFTMPTPRTQLNMHRHHDHNRAEDGRLHGFAQHEQVARVLGLLQSIGLTRSFAPLVVVLGHGSVSLNNPHAAAYDCGACSGRHGGPNARLLAAMANHPDVRSGLRERGVDIPDGTWFVGGFHNTASDEVELYDEREIPDALHAVFEEARGALDVARAHSAHERCRRFESAPRRLSLEAAIRHVEARAADLSQPRPELGHATNAMCIVGRRSLSRGAFFDRRAFLQSYDAAIDPDGAILERILVAVGPVGAGINLEYYFSRVDNTRFGCGTKLPHNLTGLLGVMEGVSGDLRTGLPRQMIEIHEPMRLLLIVEARPEILSAILGRQPAVAQLVVNEWLRVVSIDPTTSEMLMFEDGAFHPWHPGAWEPKVVASSREHYEGHMGDLDPALLTLPPPRSATGNPSEKEIARAA